jgi:hypothetical protein
VSNLQALGTEAIEALSDLISLLDALRSLHVRIDLGDEDASVIWIGRETATGESETLYSGRLDQVRSVDEGGIPNRATLAHGEGARPSSQIMPRLGRKGREKLR